MYSREEKLKAIKFYIQYDKKLRKTICKLGYPSRNALKEWYKEYMDTGTIDGVYHRDSKFAENEKEAAIKYYIEHGKNVSQTIRSLGYPSRNILKQWIAEYAPSAQRSCSYRKQMVEFSLEQKSSAVKDLIVRDKTAKEIADDFGVDRTSLYNWKNRQLGKGALTKVNKRENLPDTKEDLENKIQLLKKQIHQLQLEKDILEKTAELIKKEPGINPKQLSNSEKAELVGALRDKYRLTELLSYFDLSKSSYFYQENCMRRAEKYEKLKVTIINIFEENEKRYGYRRIHLVLRSI